MVQRVCMNHWTFDCAALFKLLRLIRIEWLDFDRIKPFFRPYKIWLGYLFHTDGPNHVETPENKHLVWFYGYSINLNIWLFRQG